MKLRIIIVLLFFSCCFFSCKKQLDQTIYGAQTDETFYKTTAQLSQALNAAYGSLRRPGWYGEFSLHFLLQDVSTDDAEKGGASIGEFPEWANIQAFTVSSSNQAMLWFWQLCYNSIYQCNLVIAKSAGVQGDAALISRMVNEAKFIRAFNYYALVTWFGDVPLITEPQQPADVFVARTTKEEVFAKIIEDLTAATALPEKGEYAATDNGRVTSGAAYAMLGKVYMFTKKYPEAETALQNIINSGNYSLVDDYGKLFTLQNNNGPESVFEIQYVEDAAGQQNGGTQNVVWFSSRVNAGGYGYHCPSKDLFNAFAPDDPRITYTFYQTGDQFTGDAYVQDCSISPTGYHDRKMQIIPADRTSVPWDIGYNAHIIRYADVLLMYAEALNENNKAGQALQYLEMVRNRARHSNPLDPKRSIQIYVPPTNSVSSLPAVTTTDQASLRTAIWNERRFELGNEGWRRDDLIRQNRFGQIMRAYATAYNTAPFKGSNFDDSRDYLMPIPQDEINRNPKLTQNPKF